MHKSCGLQIARAIAVLSIVLYHIMLLSRDYASSIVYDSAIFALKSGVDVFFVISGVVMVLSYQKQGQRLQMAKRFVIHRFARIYPPYLILTTLLALPFLFGAHYANQKHGGVDFLSSFTLLPSDRLPLVPVAWTLSYEVMFYAVFALIIALNVRLLDALAVWAVLVACGYTLLKTDYLSIQELTQPYGGFLFSPFVFEFIAGCLTALVYRSINPRYGILAICLAFCLFTLEALCFHLSSTPDVVEVGYRVALFLPPALLLVGGLLVTPHAESNKLSQRLLVWLGSISYSVYLVHILVVHAGYRFLWLKTPPALHGIFFVFIFTACIAISIAFYTAIERPSSRLVREKLETIFGVRRAKTGSYSGKMPIA